MYWPLVSTGVGGICLVLAKYWHHRRERRRELESGDGREQPVSLAHEGPRLLGRRQPVLRSRIRFRFSPRSRAASGSDRRGGEGLLTDVDAPTDAPTLAAGALDVSLPGPVREPSSSSASLRPATGRERVPDHLRVAQALACGDLAAMDTLLDDICDPVLRHQLMNRLVAHYYRMRGEAQYRAAFYRVADLQIDEASSIMEGLEEIGKGRPDQMAVFRLMAIALAEDQRPEAAVAVCEHAMALGLQDGTQAGFEGRISRLKRRAALLDADASEVRIH